jgi:ABC-2 type transport system permease protein
MRKIRLIVKREYLTRVKTKAFIIGTVLVPLIGIGFVLMILFLVNRQPGHTYRVAIVDDAGLLAPSVVQALDRKLSNGRREFTITKIIDRPASNDAVQQDLRFQINSGSLDAYLLISRDLAGPVELHTNNFSLIEPLSASLNEALIAERLGERGIHVNDVSEIVRGADLKVIRVSQSGESVEKGQTIDVAIALVILLYTSLLMYGIITMRSVLEEKTTRTMEVLISSVRPFQLLAGKILGVAAAAFTQFLIWMLSLALLSSYGIVMAKMVPGSSFSGIHLPISLLIYTVAYFIGGFFLYSAMFAAIGAACSSEQDAAQLQWLAMVPLIFCMVIYSLVLNDPASRLSLILSEIPFFSPVLMALRISLQTPPFWQIALSFALLIVTTVGVVYASAKIYRVGILMYGKRPTLPELFRWLRHS